MAKDLRVEQDSTKSLIFKIFSLDDKDTKKYESLKVLIEFLKDENFISL